MSGAGNGADFSLEWSSSMDQPTRLLSSGSVEKLKTVLHVVLLAHRKQVVKLVRNKSNQF